MAHRRAGPARRCPLPGCCEITISILLIAAPAFAQRLSISQARVQLPAFTLFLDATDDDGHALPIGGASALHATFGKDPLNVQAIEPFDPAKAGVAYLVLVDVSKSLGPREFAQVRNALEVLTDHLQPQDRMAVIRFGSQTAVVSDFTADRDVLKQKLAALARSDSQTVLHLALRQAIELGKRLDKDLPDRRAAIVLTDGKDEGSGITIDDVLNDVHDNRLPIYAIGFSRLPGSERARYFALLKRVALNSGGDFFHAADANSIADAYEKTRSAITRVYVAHATCGACAADGRAERLQATLHAGDRVLTDGIDVRILPSGEVTQAPPAATRVVTPPLPAPWYRTIPIWVYIAGGSALMISSAVLVFVIAHRRGAKDDPGPAPDDASDVAPAPVPAKPKGIPLELVVVRGQRPGASYKLALDNRAVVGTGADTDLRLTTETAVAARQFELERITGKIVIRDLTGSQSTSVNGVPIRSQYPISNGDLISAGSTELRFLVS